MKRTLAEAHQPLTDPFQVGEWVVSASLHRVSRGEETVQLGPRLMQLLLRLASTPNKVVPREELLDTVWGDVVVSEESLTVAVCELRRIFGDNQRSPRYIETIRHAGYRLVADVETDLGEKPLPDVEIEEVFPDLDDVHPFQKDHHKRLPGWLFAVAGVVVVAVLGLFVGRQLSDRRSPTEPTPLTSSVGLEIHPAISPDGNRIAYASDGGEDGGLDIWVTSREDQSVVRLTSGPSEDNFPSWSRDGSSIAFARKETEVKPFHSICIVPSSGGEVQKLTPTPGEVSGLSWSPDGYSLAYSAPENGGVRHRVWILSLRNLGMTPVPLGDEGTDFGVSPVFSPDGKRIAFVGGSEFLQDIYIYEVERGLLWRVAVDQRRIAGLAWTEGGREIVFAAHPTGSYQLWRVNVDESRVGLPEPTDITRLPVASMMATHPTISQTGDLLVYQEMQVDSDVWRIEVDTQHKRLKSSKALIASTRIDCEADFSPNGEQIVFISARSGHREVWTCDADGESVRRLTEFGGAFVTWPSWEADGERVAFSVVEAGRYRKRMTMPVSGGRPKIEHARRGGELRGWRLGLHPTGKMVYEKSDGSGIWLLGPMGRSERLLLGQQDHDRWSLASACDDGVYLLFEDKNGPLIHFFSYANEKLIMLGQLQDWKKGACANLEASSNGRLLLVDRTYSRGGSDLMLVEGFQ